MQWLGGCSVLLPAYVTAGCDQTQCQPNIIETLSEPHSKWVVGAGWGTNQRKSSLLKPNELLERHCAPHNKPPMPSSALQDLSQIANMFSCCCQFGCKGPDSLLKRSKSVMGFLPSTFHRAGSFPHVWECLGIHI